MQLHSTAPRIGRRLALSVTSITATLVLLTGAMPAQAQIISPEGDLGGPGNDNLKSEIVIDDGPTARGADSELSADPELETGPEGSAPDPHETMWVYAPPEGETPPEGAYIIPEVNFTVSPNVKDPTLSPLLNPGAIAACNFGFGERVIEKFATRYSGTISLKCGNSGAGYVHIKEEHEDDWDRVFPAGNWDDFMVFATRQVLAKPYMSRMQTSTKRCYVAKVDVYRTVNGKPRYVKSTWPRVAVSENNKLIITSFPTSRNQC